MKVHVPFLTFIPPRVLILVRRMISPDGTQNGVHKHSPVLEASWHIAHGYLSQHSWIDLNSVTGSRKV
jgi:hypothetical protein